MEQGKAMPIPNYDPPKGPKEGPNGPGLGGTTYPCGSQNGVSPQVTIPPGATTTGK